MSQRLSRLCYACILLVLLAASVLSGLPHSLLAAALILVVLYARLRPVQPGLKLVANVSLVFLSPLSVQPVWFYLGMPPAAAAVISAASILPVLYLLDDSMRRVADTTPLVPRGTGGRYLSGTAVSLFASAAALLFLSFILGNSTLLFTAILFGLYLAGILVLVFRAVPVGPLAVPLAWRRVIAGGTVSISQTVASRAPVRLRARIDPVHPWVRVTPVGFVLGRGKVELNLTITPPLAGPSRPRLRVSLLDPRGLVQIEQVVEPVELHVIPRARYAEWLAMRYLEQARPGMVGLDTAPHKGIPILKRGIEYHGSRTYQPGDQLRDVDWRHTIKFNQLIIKEYVEGGKQAAIIGLNLSVAGAEEADRLAFNLLTVALTLAEEGIPSALAAYNRSGVVLTLPTTDPREILKQALSLVKHIDSAEAMERRLELPDLDRLRRSMSRLKRAQPAPARKLLGLLDFEYRAIQYAASHHPAIVALSTVTERAPGPAMVVLVSQLNHDAEAIRVATDRLTRRDFTVITVDGNR